MKRYLIPTLAATVVFGALEFVLHGTILHDLYQQTAAVWRSADEMKSMMPLMWLGYLIFAGVFVWIYDKGYEAGKDRLGQGLRYGFWVGILIAAPSSLVWYVVLPVPAVLAWAWFVGGLVEVTVTGVVVSLLHR